MNRKSSRGGKNRFAPKENEKVVDAQRAALSERLQECDPLANRERGSRVPDKQYARPISSLWEQLNEQGFKYVMYMTAHTQLSPRSPRPAYNILGFFQKRSLAMAHYKSILLPSFGGTPPGNIGLSRTLQYFLIPTTMDKMRDGSYTNDKIERLKSNHLSTVRAQNEEFQDNLEHQKAGKQGQSVGSKRKAEKAEKRKKTRKRAFKDHVRKNEMEGVGPISRSAEVRYQNFVAVVHLRDNTEDALSGQTQPEPAILPIRPFNSEDEGVKWITDQGSKFVYSMHLDVMCMYDWIWPEDVDEDKIPNSFRNKKLDNIMSVKNDKAEEVKDFAQWCEANDMDMPTLDVTDESSASGTVRKQPDGMVVKTETNVKLPGKDEVYQWTTKPFD